MLSLEKCFHVIHDMWVRNIAVMRAWNILWTSDALTFKSVFFPTRDAVNGAPFIVNEDYLQQSTSDKRLCAVESIGDGGGEQTDEGPGDRKTYFLEMRGASAPPPGLMREQTISLNTGTCIKSQSSLRAYETAVFIEHAIFDMKKTTWPWCASGIICMRVAVFRITYYLCYFCCI